MKKIYITVAIIFSSLSFTFSQSNKESATSPIEYAEKTTAVYAEELDLNAFQEIEVYDLLVEWNAREAEIEASTIEGSEEREAQKEYEERKFKMGMASTLSDDQYEKWEEVSSQTK